MKIAGNCTAAFQGVRQEFEANFADGELGASCAVFHRGELVVDLRGGYRDLAATQAWESDTIANVWSTTKMMAALCVLMLHDRGLLSVDEPVARYWPEFSAAGKSDVLVRHVLSHTAGLPGFDPPIDADTLFDQPRAAANLAAQAPWWEPGTASGYHASTQGFLLGELVRRTSGRSLGTFFAEEIAGPLHADFHIGLAQSEFPRVAEICTAGCEATEGDASPPPDELPRRVHRGEPPHLKLVNTDRWRRAELPASNGHGNARSVARVLSCLAGTGQVDGIRLLSAATIERIFEVQAEGRDLILGKLVRFGIGYGLPSQDMPLGVNDRTCFWAGWGGSMAVVDVENNLAIAYVMNRMRSGTSGDLRAGRLIFAAHAAAKAVRNA
ncbi:MAG: serine hydrolase domain-containing protein [Deltaproteobacteria bacterium]